MRDTDQDETARPTGARAILRVPEIMAEIARLPAGATLAELALRLPIPRASLHRLLTTLTRGGYLATRSGRFTIGPEGIALGQLMAATAERPDLLALARPELLHLARETGETVMLGVLTGDDEEIVYREVIDSSAPVRFTIAAGTRRPLHSTASGLAALACLPPDRLAAWLRRADFRRFTPRTMDRAGLAARLQAAQRDGYAFDDGGRTSGAAAVAAAVAPADGSPVATLSIAGPSERICERRAHLGELVAAAARRLADGLD